MSRLSSLVLLVALSACAGPPKGADPDTGPVDGDGDGYTAALDCDDADATVGGPGVMYPDADGDGFVDAAAPYSACADEGGGSPSADGPDCDDADAAVGGPATWWVDADGDGHGNPDYALASCAAPTGYVAVADDCDDGAATSHPDADELCDGADNDCDGAVDDGLLLDAWFRDVDADGFGDRDATVDACVAPSGYVADARDCDDASGTVNPDAAEVCGDEVDNNCAGGVDEECLSTGPGEWSGLDHLVTDAEFDRVNNWIVTVSADEEALYVIDPAAGTVDTVPLPLAPLKVSVDLAGGEAVVGHDAWVSVVDLTTRTLLDTFETSASPADIVHGGNGYAYIFPDEGQWTDIHSLDLLTGIETPESGGSSLREDTLAKLHPDGDRMYGADNGLSPSDFERYDITGGVASVSYDSPYHGDYSFSGDIWISDDGARLFARSTNVFRASSASSSDMTYAGQLSGVSSLAWVDTCSATDRVYAVEEADSPDVAVFDLAYLGVEGTYTLPEMAAGSRDYPMAARWVFARADGGGIYVIGELPGSSGAALPYAVVAIPDSELP